MHVDEGGEIFDLAENITDHEDDPEDFPKPGPIGKSEFTGAGFSPGPAGRLRR